MSCYSGPEITNDGLVLYYDMNNTQKSWKGAPTTNMAGPTLSTWVVDGSGNATIGTRTDINAFECSVVNNGSSNYRLAKSIVTSPGVAYTFSVKFKKIYGTPVMTFQIQAKDAVEAIVNSIFTTTAQLGITDTSDYQTASYTFTPGTGSTHVIWFINTGQDYLSYTNSFYWKEIQMEVGSFATPYVNGSRTTSTALLDLTNNNTLTATSLTYDANNTFSFNGTSNYVDVASNSALQFLGTLPYTLEAWVYPTANPGASNWTGIFNREANVGLGRDGFNMHFLGSAGTATYFITERFCSGVPTTAGGITVDQSVSVNNWSYLVATYDGSNLKLYRNGTLQSSVASANNITNATTNLTIGKRDTNYFNGKISLAKVYNTAFSTDQITQNFNAIRGRYGI